MFARRVVKRAADNDRTVNMSPFIASKCVCVSCVNFPEEMCVAENVLFAFGESVSPFIAKCQKIMMDLSGDSCIFQPKRELYSSSTSTINIVVVKYSPPSII